MSPVCLNMIVRNERERIIRALASVAPHITSYAIVDTGSTDGTPELIQSFFETWGIPGEIARRDFDNFENARNHALEVAADLPYSYDYVLFVDADMEFVVRHPDWLPTDKNGAAYSMLQRAGSLSYHNIRLARRSALGQYKYRGVTHEYFDAPSAGTLDNAFFIDYADGANRKDKFERDTRLLEGALKEDPDNPRTWFYLAQSYRDAGQHLKAADAYECRVQLGGWDEEVWNAQLNHAACLREMGDEKGFVVETMKAYQMRPSRAESLYDLAKYFREKGDNATSLLFSDAGRKIPYPRDVLFVADHVYNGGLDSEFSIAAFYQERRRQEGFAVCDKQALSRSVVPHYRDLARWNLYHYLPRLAELAPSFEAKRVTFDAPEGYHAMNPSITEHFDTLYMNIRTVNYEITPQGGYAILGGDGSINDSNPINTRNFVARLAPDLTVEYAKEVAPPVHMPPPKYKLVIGFEDPRLFHWRGALWTSSCVREMNPEGYCEQVLARLSEEAHQFVFTDVRRMLRQPRMHEKNWMPVVGHLYDKEHPNDLRFAYKLGEMVDYRDGKTLSKHEPHLMTDDLRGGAQLLRFGSVWLALVHEAHFIPGTGQRFYLHRFVEMTDLGRVARVSAPFVFNDRQIEFAAGMAWVPGSNDIAISYGVRDKEAWLGVVSGEEVMRMLKWQR